MSAMEWLQLHHAPGDSGGLAGPPRDGAPWILVADDELVVRDLLESFLVLEGYKVMCAEDGIQALEMFQQHAGTFEVVILDVLMPRMDGRDALDALRKIDPSIPVIVMSGFAPGERVEEMIGQPGTSFITKPFVLGDVLIRIESVLGQGARPRSTWLTEPTSPTSRLEGITD
jgi:two-component system cell cycle sensor histidine kinase/response regulator CckA